MQSDRGQLYLQFHSYFLHPSSGSPIDVLKIRDKPDKPGKKLA